MYHYAGNNPIRYIDPDGRSPWELFENPDDAAKDFARLYNDDSIRRGVEFGSIIHKTEDGKYYYETPYTNNEKNAVQHSIDSSDTTIYALIHTHGEYNEEIMCEFFSFGEEATDIGNAQELNLISYLVTPGGKLLKYTPTGDYNWQSFGDVEYITDSAIPSDPNTPERHRSTNVDATKGQNNYFIRRNRK